MKLGSYHVRVKPSALIVPCLCMGYGLYQYLTVRRLPHAAINLVLIEPVFLLMIIFTIWALFKDASIRRIAEEGGAPEDALLSGKPQIITPLGKKMCTFVLFSGLYLVFMPSVGFIISNLIFMVAVMWVLGVRKWSRLIIISVVATLTVYLLFEVWMQVPIPEGLLRFLQ